MLDPEELYLWQCARTWRDPQPVLPRRQSQWERVVEIALENGMATLLHDMLARSGGLQLLPEDAACHLQRELALYNYRARLFSRELRRFLRLAAKRDLEVVVLKGLWLSLKVYGQANVRPGGDVDILLRRFDVRHALNILDYEMGYGRWWRPLLDDAYYARHHLHQQRCNPGRAVWFEPHWRFDHPYTLLTIDYEAMFDRTRAATLLGQAVRELAPRDLLLSLAVHLVKHAVYLPFVLERPDLRRLILADGMLMYFVDVAEVLRAYEDDLDWTDTVALSRRSGASVLLGTVLRVCARHLSAPVPAEVLDAFPPPQTEGVRATLMEGMAESIVGDYQGGEANPLWRFFSGYKESLIFRPVRLLDLLRYCLPGSGYLRRRYGSASGVWAIAHFIRSLGQYAAIGADTLYYTWLRRRRLKRLNPQELDRCDARYDPLLVRRGDDATHAVSGRRRREAAPGGDE